MEARKEPNEEFLARKLRELQAAQNKTTEGPFLMNNANHANANSTMAPTGVGGSGFGVPPLFIAPGYNINTLTGEISDSSGHTIRPGRPPGEST